MPLRRSLSTRQCTADQVLALNRGKKRIESSQVPRMLGALAELERQAYESLKEQLPKAMKPVSAHPFPV